MKKLIILVIIFCVILVGCSQEKTYMVWVDATQGQGSIDSSIERLTNAEVDFIIDENGSVLVNVKDMEKAVMCCS